ncbi:MAG: adenylosuccinate synthase [Planctomycetes bacterium]|jgi:adenylosuccinate synthase|nr:adenylosuccinate synthase [Planctomycetota bacterium]
MPSVVVVGAQWGDEGKAKIVDILSAEADWVVRFQGGPNAGHTVVVGEETFRLHLIPSGIVRPGLRCLVAQGVVVDPEVLFREADGIAARGIPFAGRLFVSDRAHLIMPWHRILDGLKETRGDSRTGTTQRGIGPCYADKVSYRGIRVSDLMDPPWFEERLHAELHAKNAILTKVYGHEPLSADRILADYMAWRERLRPLVVDGSLTILDALDRGERVLFEGAQGFMLDVDAGTYPFVTGSNASVLGLPAGAGLSPRRVDRLVGVAKAYCTRVGDGPFPTEDLGTVGAMIRDAGHEFGTTTGRPRRCGWFDAVAVRYAARVSGFDELAITKLDVLRGLPEIRMAVAYEIDGRHVTDFPASLRAQRTARPVYRDFPGFGADIAGARDLSDLPAQAREYLAELARIVGVPVRTVSVGPERGQVLGRG